MLLRIFALLFVFQICYTNATAQKKYQSLMWKISGNGLTKPSYMYGTMHISGKMVFHLGDPFYNAMKEVDVVALELEPEAWLEAIFEDKSRNLYSNRGSKWTNEYGFEQRNTIPELKGQFVLNTDIQNRVKEVLMFDPALLNYLMMRHGSYGLTADYEENTWLDMHIYQTGKKLGKASFGLETYEQSSKAMKNARKEEMLNKEKQQFDEKDWIEQESLLTQLEPAYRKQDLDLIDSLNKRTSGASFDKYILVERNKVFLANMDSIMKTGKSLFAGMGCAHLPGQNGIIEMLRELGYTVEPYNKGEHSGKQRSKLENQIFKRAYQKYSTSDQAFSFNTPAKVYALGGDQDGSTWLSLDIANGASFSVSATRSYAGLQGFSSADQLASIDSILYESVAGTIVSKKKIMLQEHQGFEVMNKTRRGDYQRCQIFVLPEIILVARLSATGEKVRSGYGAEFFNSLKINLPASASPTTWTSTDGTMTMQLPGSAVHFNEEAKASNNADIVATSFDGTNNTFYFAKRHVVEEPGFIDEDNYELTRLADAFQTDNKLTLVQSQYMKHDGLPALHAQYTNSRGKSVFAMMVIQNLSYYSFSVWTESLQMADAYFQSIKLQLPTYKEYFSYADTTNHFTVQIPYQHDHQISEEEEEYEWYLSSQEDKKNIYYGKSAQTTLAVPGNAEKIDIYFQRYHRFSDGDDTLEYVKNREQTITRNDYHIHSKKVIWNDNGVVMEHILSDTLSARRKWIKQILHHKSLYQLECNYDSILGPSDFLKKVYESFEPTDTVFAFHHFENMDQAYLDALQSTDSTTQVNARKMSGDMDFSAASAPNLRAMLRNLPATADDEQKARLKENLTYGLQYDTSQVNIDFIKEEYYKNMDSAYYQLDLMQTLLLMKNRKATLAFKQLILDEPPIVRERSVRQLLNTAQDSLLLAKLLMPEIWPLVSLNEYEENIYQLAGTLADSALIPAKVIEPELAQIMLQAKNEMKRLNAHDEDDYAFNTTALINYCRLLQPFRKRTDVDVFFKKAYSTKKTRLLMDLVEFDLQHKVEVPDTIFKRIATKEQHITGLYKLMFEHKVAHRFLAEYSTREAMIKLYIKENYKFKTDKTVQVDSLDIFHSTQVEIRGDQLDVYYCKYKRSDSKQWKGIILMFDAKDKTNLWPKYIESSKNIVLDAHEDDMKEMDAALQQLIERNRKQRNFGRSTASYEFDMY